MRAIRTTTISILALGLLAGSAVGVAAQDEEAAAEPPVPVRVTGSIEAGGGFDFGTVEVTQDDERGVEERRGSFWDDPIALDEPRLSGQLRSTLNMDTYGGRDLGGDGSVVTARTELVNDGGTWTGTLRGYSYPHMDEGFPQRDLIWHIELTGTGAYEGNSALLYAQGSFNDGLLEVDGLVFPGELPGYPDTVELPAE